MPNVCKTIYLQEEFPNDCSFDDREVVAYVDKTGTIPYHRWPWYAHSFQKPKRTSKRVTINYRLFNIEWLEPRRYKRAA